MVGVSVGVEDTVSPPLTVTPEEGFATEAAFASFAALVAPVLAAASREPESPEEAEACRDALYPAIELPAAVDAVDDPAPTLFVVVEGFAAVARVVPVAFFVAVVVAPVFPVAALFSAAVP